MILRFTGFLILLSCILTAAACDTMAESGPLSLEDVLSSTKERHPLLKATVESRRQAEAELLSAFGAFDTTVSFESYQYGSGKYDGNVTKSEVVQPLRTQGAELFAGYRNTSGEIPSYDDELLTGEGGEIKAGLRLPLLRNRTLDRPRAELVRASLERTFATARINERKIELIRGASIAFWSWVAHGERVRIATQLLQVAKERGRQLQSRVKGGDLPQFDLDDNNRAVLQREAGVYSAQRSLQKSALELSLFLRNADGTPRVPSPEVLPRRLLLPTINMLPEPEAAFARRPELLRVEAEMERNKLELALSENQLLPSVDLSVGASNDLGASGEVSNQAELVFGLRVKFPLQNREARGKRSSALSKAEQLKHTRSFLREKARNELRDAEIGMRLSLQKYEAAVKEHALAEELQRGERTRFQLGDSSLIFVNLREQTSAEAATRVVDALLEAHVAAIDYNAAAAFASDEALPFENGEEKVRTMDLASAGD